MSQCFEVHPDNPQPRLLKQAAQILHAGGVVAVPTDSSYALVLGLLNTLVRPILILLTLPVTLLTLGLFLFVINALMFWAAASVLEGLHVTGFWAALVGSLLYSLCALVIDMAMEALFNRKEA